MRSLVPADVREEARNTSTERHLRAVSPAGGDTHEHIWALRETEYDDSGTTINRFECHCGDVWYT